jgi:hypothetical protein
VRVIKSGLNPVEQQSIFKYPVRLEGMPIKDYNTIVDMDDFRIIVDNLVIGSLLASLIKSSTTGKMFLFSSKINYSPI